MSNTVIKNKDKDLQKINVLKFFQKLSRAFLVPIALISAGSLLLGIASILGQAEIINVLPFLGSFPVQYFATLLTKAGLLVLANLPVIYAISLAFALADDEKDYAAFSGFLGYFAFIISMGVLIDTFPNFASKFPGTGISNVLGIKTVNAGILGGMLAGILVAIIHNKFRNIKLPMAFAFFQGVRFVPIASIILLTIVGQIFPFIWVYFSMGIGALGNSINSLGIFGPFVYGTVERLLIPTGLHQIWNAIIRNTAVSGIYTFKSGFVAEGALVGFAQYLAEGLPNDTSLVELVKYLFGPQNAMMLGGLPAIGLAIYHSADKDKRQEIKPLIVTGVVTAFLVGISEPLEFTFLFAAPLLFLIYALFTGLAWLLCYILGSAVGGANSGIIYFIINGVMRPDSKWWIILIVTVFEAVSLYFLFMWWIKKFDVKTPGRGGDYDDSLAFAAEISNVNMNEKQNQFDTSNPEVLKAQIIIRGLGGKENIKEVDSCMSRLRVEVIDGSKVSEEILKKTGCNGVVRPDKNNVQVIYGTTVGLIKKTVIKELNK